VALTFRRQLQLAWVLWKLETRLRRLPLFKPKKNHLRRTVVLGSALAASVFVAGAVCGRRGLSCTTSGAHAPGATAGSHEQHTSAAEPERERSATDTDGPRDIEARGRA
jgi:hypothetical protein